MRRLSPHGRWALGLFMLVQSIGIACNLAILPTRSAMLWIVSIVLLAPGSVASGEIIGALGNGLPAAQASAIGIAVLIVINILAWRCAFTIGDYFRPKKIAPPRDPERQDYPDLDILLGAYFHQDCTIDGASLADIIADFKAADQGEISGNVIAQIHAFIARHGESDAALVASFDRIFAPGIIIDGNWDGMTARQWLLKVADLLA